MIRVQKATALKSLPFAPAPAPHERRLRLLRRMANDMRDISSLHGGVQQSDLIQAGYSQAEIDEAGNDAASLASQAYERQQFSASDELETLTLLASEAKEDKPAAPHGTLFSPAQLAAWQAYCRSRAAFEQDPWHVLRHRCAAMLLHYLLTLTIPAITRNRLVAAIEAELKAKEEVQ